MNNTLQNCTEAPCSKTFISPYSSNQNYTLEWTKVSPRVKIHTDRIDDWATDKVLDFLSVLDQVKIMTRGQIIKTFWPCKKSRKGEVVNRIKKLVSFGALVSHNLKGKYKNIVIYTLGPVGASKIKKTYDPNWWLELKVESVLKQLIANQFYLRVYRNIPGCYYKIGLYPITGVVFIRTSEEGTVSEFPLVITRNDVTDIVRELKWTPLEKAIIICEKTEDIEKIVPIIKDTGRFRFTTDENMCTVPLQKAFYMLKNNELIQEFNPIFPKDA